MTNKSAVALGKLGGKATAAALTSEERSASCRHAAASFWAGKTTEERSAIMKARAAKRRKKLVAREAGNARHQGRDEYGSYGDGKK